MAYPAEDGLGLGAKILLALLSAGGGLAMAYWVFLLERRAPRMPTIVAVEEEDASVLEDVREDSEREEEDEDSVR